MQGLLTDCQQETLERLVRESLANPTANRDGWDWPSDMKRLHCAVVIALLIRGLVKVADDGALIPTARGVEFSGVKPPREVRPSSAQRKKSDSQFYPQFHPQVEVAEAMKRTDFLYVLFTEINSTYYGY